ncbi:MAG: CoA-binding protein [Limnochordaceae bacterium]|nr:CoA-binding protein [Limnochordaceae bacterium]
MAAWGALDALFAPRRIAVVGASRDPRKPGGLIFRYLLESRSQVYPVNPSATEILGHRTWPDLASLPAPIDLAVIATPAAAAPDVVRACARRGVPVAVVVAGGFGETGPEGRQLESEMAAAARAGGVRLLGPNTLGVLVPSTGLDTMFVVRERCPRPGPGPVAFISQSGATAVTRMNAAAWEGLGFHSFVGLGNRVDIDENELLPYLAALPEVKAIALYLESFSDGARFFETVRSLGARVPICLVKTGRSPAGARAAALHTGALAPGERVVGGILRQLGIYRAYDDEELVDVAWALARAPLPAGDGVAVLVSAGGHGVMMADYLEAPVHSVHLRLSRLAPETCDRLRSVVLPFAAVDNPVDLTASATVDMVEQALAIVGADPAVHAILCGVQLEPPGLDARLIDVVTAFARSTGKPVIAFSIGSDASLEARRALNRAGVPAYPSLWRAARALGALVEHARRVRAPRGLNPPSGP